MALRFLLTVSVITFSTSIALAQTSGGPPIAYVKRLSNGDEIYLVHPDSTGLIRVYKARSKVQVTMIDLKPGGGEIAFTEGSNTLKILAFDQYGRAEPGNPREIRRVSSPCSVEAPDYHPTNGSLIYTEGCGRDRAVWSVASGASERSSAPLFSATVFRNRWSASGDAIYYVGLRPNAGSSDPAYLYRFANSDHQELGVLNDWQTFDVTRVGDKVFWGNNNNFWLFDRSTSTTTSDAELLACPQGTRMTRSSNDTQMVFQSPWARGKGNYVMIGATDCLTDPTALTAAGSWGWLDWRN